MNTEVLEPTRKALLLALYKEMFPTVAAYISKRGGTFEMARDIFHDALIFYYEKMPSLKIHTHENAYLMGIVKHLWIKKQNENNRFTSLEVVPDITETQPQTPATDRLLNFVKRAGQKCLDLLTAFYYDKASMGKISSQFGFSGERSATVQKFKCLEKVRNTIKEKELQYEDFFE